MTSGFSHALLVTGSRTWDAAEAMKAALGTVCGRPTRAPLRALSQGC